MIRLLQRLIDFYYDWEIQASVILSMLIQFTLVAFGSRRKTSAAMFTRMLVWLAYLTSDSLISSSLRRLVQNGGESCKEVQQQNHQLYLLWAPFLILHSGTPDNISAYSILDNVLWIRHVYSLVVNVWWAIYVIINYWNKHNPLSYLIIPILVSGVLRYCERVCALYYSHLLSSGVLTTRPEDPCGVSRSLVTLTAWFTGRINIVDRKLVCQQKDTILLKKTPEQAFKLVETELGVLYDYLYTKAFVSRTPWGIRRRCVYIVSSLATLTSFVILYKHNKVKWSYPVLDVSVTLFLMIGDIILEIYAIILIHPKHWKLIWLNKNQRWSRSIKQHNIIEECDSHSVFSSIKRKIPLVCRWRRFDPLSGDAVKKLNELVFNIIKESRAEDIARVLDMKPFVVFHGIVGHVFQNHDCLEELRKNTIRSKFDTSLFIWHIATALCYCSDRKKMEQLPTDSSIRRNADTSRYMSDYFMYLTCDRRELLPIGKYNSLYLSTESDIVAPRSVCEQLLDRARRPSSSLPQDVEDTDSAAATTVVKRGVAVAVTLLEIEEGQRWEMIREVWALVLLYAASQIKWEEHQRFLSFGGEFITHVAVFLVHAFLADREIKKDEEVATKLGLKSSDGSKLEEREREKEKEKEKENLQPRIEIQ